MQPPYMQHAHVAAPPQGQMPVQHVATPPQGQVQMQHSTEYDISETTQANTKLQQGQLTGIQNRPVIKVALLPGERQLCEMMQSTLTCPGQPYYKVMFTDKRLVIVTKRTALCCLKEDHETSIMYRDIVDVHVAASTNRWKLWMGLVLLILGIAVFALFIATGEVGAAFGVFALVGMPGVYLLVDFVIMELMMPGDLLCIDVCKVGTNVNTWNPWGRATVRHAHKTIPARLSTQDAYSAMYMLLDHPDVPLLHYKQKV